MVYFVLQRSNTFFFLFFPPSMWFSHEQVVFRGGAVQCEFVFEEFAPVFHHELEQKTFARQIHNMSTTKPVNLL